MCLVSSVRTTTPSHPLFLSHPPGSGESDTVGVWASLPGHLSILSLSPMMQHRPPARPGLSAPRGQSRPAPDAARWAGQDSGHSALLGGRAGGLGAGVRSNDGLTFIPDFFALKSIGAYWLHGARARLFWVCWLSLNRAKLLRWVHCSVEGMRKLCMNIEYQQCRA